MGIFHVSLLFQIRRPGGRGCCWLGAWLGGLLALAMTIPAGAAESAAVPAITSFSNYWSAAYRAATRPIQAEILVTYHDPEWGLLWGISHGEPGYMPCAPGLPLAAGDRVVIEGTVVPSQGLRAETIKLRWLARGEEIPSIDARGRLTEFDFLRSKVVTFEAWYNRQDLSEPHHIQLDLLAEGMRVHLYHWLPEARSLNLPDGALLRVTGLYNPLHQAGTETLEIDVWVSRLEDIEVVGTLATERRFEQPLSAIETLPQRFDEGGPQVRVAGRVHAFNPRRSLILRDSTGQVTVRTQQLLSVETGDVVEAVGRPFTGATEWVLRDGLVRKLRPAEAEKIRAVALAPQPVLRLAEQVLMLAPADAAGTPVDLIGVVIRPLAFQGYIFLADATGVVRVELDAVAAHQLKNGAGLRIRGFTTDGAFAPGIRAESVEHWGIAVLPEARPLSLEQAMSGQEEGRRIELRGYVSKVVVNGEVTRLKVGTATGEFTAVVRSHDTWPSLEGSIVAVRGVCQAVADSQRQLTGIELIVSDPEDVHVEQARLLDQQAVPLRAIASFRQFSSPALRDFWVRVRGVVTHRVPGRLIFLQDGADGLMVLTNTTVELAPGDVVEATGLSGLDGRRPVLREATIRPLDQHQEPTTITVSQPSTIVDGLEDSLIKVRGTLISAAAETGELLLLLRAEDKVFAAVLPEAGEAARQYTWAPGSELELTGIYEILRDERRRTREFRLQLRSLEDITVLARPSWWTPERALLITLGLCSFIVGGLGWLFSLRRRVRQQTRQIRTQLAKEANLEARHRDIVENASDFIFTTDHHGKLTSLNPAGERISGYDGEEALNLYLRDLLVPDQQNLELWERLQTEASGTITFQSHLRTKDGRIVWTETSTRLIREGGRPAGLLGIVRDISERKQIEEELTRARDAAEANTRMKSSFLANMSHEIRTPMNGVIGMSNLLLDTRLDGEQREFAETIRSSAESLLTVLNDILDFSKIEAGKLHFEAVDFSPLESVESALDLLAPRAAAKGIELAAFISPDVPRFLRGDPGRLRQVLLNLLGNAVKFTERGEVVLHATVLEQNEQEAMLRFEVSDTGVGIAPDVVQRLFRPFSQADGSTTRRFGGTGLGLAIAKQIIELMDGTIGVQSRVGAGSTFWFTIPLPKPAEPVPVELTAPVDDLTGLRILAVDDVATNRRILSHYTRVWGLRAEVVADARLALHWLRQAAAEGDPFRLVISDYQMPQIDGLMLARELRSDASLRQTPFLLFTPLDRRLAPVELQELGITAVVTKPIRVHELLTAVRAALVPLVTTPTRQDPSPPAAPFHRETTAAPRRGRVLVAEDNPVNQRVILLQLQRMDYAVDVAGNGFEVLAALDRASYDLILMDCQMPEMDGFETTCRIRTGSHSDVYIIALTANAMEGDRESCLSGGMDDYLSKPTRPSDLQAALQRATKRRALSRPPEAVAPSASGR